jgi:hypothetical protein
VSTAPVEREFELLRPGFIRQLILTNFREGLRSQTNPETGATFTEAEIERATRERSRWYNQSQGIDDYGQLEQRRALFLVDQSREERASTKWLLDNMRRRGLTKNPAQGATFTASQLATPGTIILGSTTLGSPAAYKCGDSAGKTYQVIETVETPAEGVATITLKGISTGLETNLDPGVVLKWLNKDPSMAATCTVLTKGVGGGPEESDAEAAERVASIRKHREGAGNDPQMRTWARASHPAVEDASIYPCYKGSGSTLICVTQRRGTTTGPNGRLANSLVLAAVIDKMTPPSSPHVPGRAFILSVTPQPESTDLVFQAQIASGSLYGWSDPVPFPRYHATLPTIATVTEQSSFTFTSLADSWLPGQSATGSLSGAEAPDLMVWNETTSRFEELSVSSVTCTAENEFTVALSSPAVATLAIGMMVCPDVARRLTISKAIERHFDSMGPGQLFNLLTDDRGARAVRFPPVNEERTDKLLPSIATRITDSIGGGNVAVQLTSASKTTPSYPTFAKDGPFMLVPGKVGLYPL